MKKISPSTHDKLRAAISCLLLVLIPGLLMVLILGLATAPAAFAQDEDPGQGQEIVLSANLNLHSLSISYDGLGAKSPLAENSLPYFINAADGSDQTYEADLMGKIGQKLKFLSGYFSRYFAVDGLSGKDENPYTLKSMVDTRYLNPNAFDFNLSLSVGYDTAENLKMDAVKLSSHFRHTYVNAIYHYEKNEIELGLSSKLINDRLMDGMKLELQANPSVGGAAVLLSMGF